MATWHQQQHPAHLWHETQWTVVEDAPGEPTCCSRFDTTEAAQIYKNSLDRRGRGKHAYILPPMQVRMRS